MKSHNFRKIKTLAILITMSLFVAACGGGGSNLPGLPTPSTGGPSSGDPNGAVAISGLTVTGTGTSNNVTTVDPNTNGGAFSISFSTSGPGAGAIYIADAVINLNGLYNGGATSNGDYRVASGCGATTISDSCHNNIVYSCTFNTSNVVSCVNQMQNPVPITISLQQIMKAVPQNAYVVAYVCNGFLSQCTSQSLPIILQ